MKFLYMSGVVYLLLDIQALSNQACRSDRFSVYVQRVCKYQEVTASVVSVERFCPQTADTSETHGYREDQLTSCDCCKNYNARIYSEERCMTPSIFRTNRGSRARPFNVERLIFTGETL